LNFLRPRVKEELVPLEPDPDAEYDQVIEVDLHTLEPSSLNLPARIMSAR
jgi:aconitase A